MLIERELREHARELRRNPTEWEVWLWRQLSRKFRRKRVIFPYICDVFCPSKGLIVELDGDTHDAEQDRKRDARLARHGFATLRFTNADVRENIEGVVTSIVMALQERPERWAGLPHPNPSPEGEGLIFGSTTPC